MPKFVNIPLDAIAEADAIGFGFLHNVGCYGGSGGSGGDTKPYLTFAANEVIDHMNAIIAKAMKLRGLAEKALEEKPKQ